MMSTHKRANRRLAQSSAQIDSHHGLFLKICRRQLSFGRIQIRVEALIMPGTVASVRLVLSIEDEVKGNIGDDSFGLNRDSYAVIPRPKAGESLLVVSQRLYLSHANWMIVVRLGDVNCANRPVHLRCDTDRQFHGAPTSRG